MSKISEAIQDLRAYIACSRRHVFTDVKARADGGLSAVCSECKCRITAWPGTTHYEEIAAARERKGEAG